MRLLGICMPSFAVSWQSSPAILTSLHFLMGTDKEIEIVYDLSQNVLRHEEMLTHASDICGELDRLGSGACSR